LKFGIKLPHSGPLASPVAVRTIAIEAEKLDFDSVWVHDHISYGRNWIGHRSSGLAEQITPEYEPELFEAITTLAYVAGVTKRIRIGTSVLVIPLRNPLVLGRELITLQALSAGRLALGVAVGDYPDEFEALHVPYKERGKITDEYLEVLHKIFRGGLLEHHGTYLTCDEAYFYHRIEAPPVFIGGGVIAVSDPAEDTLALPVLRRVARLADGWMPDWGSPSLIRKGAKIIKQLSHDYGRQNNDLEIAMHTTLYLCDTDEEAKNKTAQSVQGAEEVANIVAKFGTRSTKKAYERSLIGSPTSIAVKVAQYADAGVGLFVMKCLAPDVGSFVDMLGRFSKEVAPFCV